MFGSVSSCAAQSAVSVLSRSRGIQQVFCTAGAESKLHNGENGAERISLGRSLMGHTETELQWNLTPCHHFL